MNALDAILSEVTGLWQAAEEKSSTTSNNTTARLADARAGAYRRVMDIVRRAQKTNEAAATSYLAGTQVAARLGIQPATWRAYVARQQCPPADVWVGDIPGWLPETIDGWQRPGQGARTDRR